MTRSETAGPMDDPETPDIKMSTVDEILGRMKSNKLDTS